MKYLYALLVLPLLIVTGCCNKECDPPVVGIRLSYSGFSPAETDTLMVYHYSEGNYTQILDSNLFAAQKPDTLTEYQFVPVRGNSYILRLLHGAKPDTISNIEWLEGSCKACFKKNTYFVPTKLSLNGVNQESMKVKIKK